MRDYDLLTGPETPTLPTATTPSVSTDFMTKGYADSNYGGFGSNVLGTRASPILITAAGGITPTSSIGRQLMFIKGNGGAIDITKNPQIVTSGARLGDELRLYGCDDTNTVQIDHGTGVVGNGSQIMGADWIIDYMFNGTDWCEVGPK